MQGTGGMTSGRGGSSASGGGSGTGGSTGTGGSLTGGTPGTGGNTGAGGTTASGGATGTGGGGTDAGRPDVATGGNGVGGSGTGGAATGGAGGGTGGSTGGSTGTCPSGSKPADGTVSLTVGSLSRKYILHVPSAYTGSTPVPLVLDFHPIGGSASQWRTSSPYPAVIDKEGVISAFPDGLTGPMGQAWNVVGCCVSKVNGADVDDVAFAKAIVTDIEKVACIDTKRIYAVGFSMGGGMSNWLACKAPDVFAAAGPASFDLTQQNEAQCTPSRPITVIEWRGKGDTVVVYAGGHSTAVSGMALDFLGAVGTFQKWASIDGCTGNPSAADSNGCQTYSQCSASVQVTLCTSSGGHEAANAGIVWPMLKKYTLP
jgi:polyhydroxybutyrate depolymerase